MTNNIPKNLFISVKPEFAEKIVAKEKEIELRKTKPNVTRGDNIIIYASFPSKSIIGFGVIEQIIEMSPSKMWQKYSLLLGIDKLRFDNYYNGREIAIGILIKDVRRIAPFSLEKIRCITPDFQPPQIYRYVSNNEIGLTDKHFSNAEKPV